MVNGEEVTLGLEPWQTLGGVKIGEIMLGGIKVMLGRAIVGV